MDHREELLKQVNQLLHILKQLLKSGASTGSAVWSDELGRQINVNICLFDVVSSVDEDMDGFEQGSEELPDSEFVDEQNGREEALSFELTSRDLDFLKINGLKF